MSQGKMFRNREMRFTDKEDMPKKTNMTKKHVHQQDA